MNTLHRKSRNDAKKDVGHGGLDEWFSGHGKDKGEATWGDWVAISPVKKQVKQELADGTVKKKTIHPGDIIGPCGVSDDPNWKALTRDGKDPLKCMPRQKAHDTPKKERAELAKEKMRTERDEGNKGKKPTRTRTFEKEATEVVAGDNEPTNPDLWEKSKATAKKRYNKWPSAYAVGHALKIYKDEGGKWRKKSAVDLSAARQFVAAQHYLRQEVRRLAQTRIASPQRDQVRRELTAPVLLSFVEASGIRVATIKVALDVVRKVKQLWDAFTTAPKAWENFKRALGVRADSLLGAVKELPRKILALGKQGKDVLHRLGNWLVAHVPFLQIYVNARGKMPTLNTYLLRLADYLPPRVSSVLRAVGKKAHDLATMIDQFIEKHPVAVLAGTGVSAALFTFIWLNVTEISWDIPDIIKGFLGLYTFAELLKSLPEAGVGLVLSILFPGLPSRYLLNAILPVSVALRIAWLVAQDYAKWENGTLTIAWDQLGVAPPSDPQLAEAV